MYLGFVHVCVHLSALVNMRVYVSVCVLVSVCMDEYA